MYWPSAKSNQLQAPCFILVLLPTEIPAWQGEVGSVVVSQLDASPRVPPLSAQLRSLILLIGSGHRQLLVRATKQVIFFKHKLGPHFIILNEHDKLAIAPKSLREQRQPAIPQSDGSPSFSHGANFISSNKAES